MIVVTISEPLLVPYSTVLPSGQPLGAPSFTHLLGTDQLGRDQLSRVLLGMRSSWWGAIGVILASLVAGGTIGLIAGTLGGFVDTLLMRLTDLFLSLPGSVLAIAVVAALGDSFFHVLLALSLVWWTLYARVTRGEVTRLRASPHAEAAKLVGVGHIRLGLRHLLPGALPPLVVTATLDLGALILMLSGLSVLGLGAPQPAAELGAMTQQGMPNLLTNWWIPVIPAAAIAVLVLIANFAGDALRALMGDR
jgi:ABC-type dipeptide/oligopeptide/nickel transport system permease subunit